MRSVFLTGSLGGQNYLQFQTLEITENCSNNVKPLWDEMVDVSKRTHPVICIKQYSEMV